MPELDRYDADGIDENEDLEELSDGARLAVEEQLDRRDRRARGELPAAFEGTPPQPRSKAPALQILVIIRLPQKSCIHARGYPVFPITSSKFGVLGK